MICQDDIKIICNINKYTPADNIKTIANNTAETWQPNRSAIEKEKDTNLGKLAENIISSYIKISIPQIRYLSYDDFRKDGFTKHAPFDGLLFANNINEVVLNGMIDKINDEVNKDDYGKITDGLKDEIASCGIYITEIKSTRITKRHKFNNNVDLDKILNDDFLEYPKYTRYDKNDTINDFQSYIAFIKENKGLVYSEKELKNIEKANMRHIYVRIYIDIEAQNAYIIGVISKDSFIKNAIIKKMKQVGKSEKALYLAVSLRKGENIDILSKLNPT